jgi:PAS domain S-box-containing protein
MRWWPRSIRWQMLTGLLLLEVLSVGLFAALLTQQQSHRVYVRSRRWLDFESTAMAMQIAEGLEEQSPARVATTVRTTGTAPNIALVKVTDPEGNVLYISRGEANQARLEPAEQAQISLVPRGATNVFTMPGDQWEGVHAIYAGNQLRGYVWVLFDKSAAREQLAAIQRDTLVFGIIWVAASLVLVLLMGRAIARPLAVLHRGTATLMSSPDGGSGFPLPVTVHNEIGDVIETFNRMVSSLAEQRAGLNDTLSLLDSMLANAPIGLAFVDRNLRFVRVNQIFADLTGVAVSRHLGRTLADLLPKSASETINGAVQRVFTGEEAVRNLELNGHGGKPSRPWTWLISAYPVRTMPNQVRWAGIIALDASDRKRSEEALRRSEKLAVTGRLAASIAHEINNPLEAITNLVFLLRNNEEMPQSAQHYLAMAEQEVRRISEITQQTLRFYRQPTLPARSTMAELLDSVLSLYQSRLNALELRVERDYDPETTLFCFSSEIRQVIANLVGNALDASSTGGRLLVRAHRSRDWKNSLRTGIRFVIADNGIGMDSDVRPHIFEAFFTTKESTGTGLGLWVSHEIILKHHGVVHVKSRSHEEDGHSPPAPSGTVFQFFIPDEPDGANGLDATTSRAAAAS